MILLIAGSYLAGTRHEVIVASQFQQSRIEMDLTAMTLENG